MECYGETERGSSQCTTFLLPRIALRSVKKGPFLYKHLTFLPVFSTFSDAHALLPPIPRVEHVEIGKLSFPTPPYSSRKSRRKPPRQPRPTSSTTHLRTPFQALAISLRLV